MRGFTSTVISARVPYQQPDSSAAILSVLSLEHGAYYAGMLGQTSMVARWHAHRRRFVFEDYALGRHRTRSVAHVGADGRAEGFAPRSKTSPTPTTRVSDYAFETAG